MTGTDHIDIGKLIDISRNPVNGIDSEARENFVTHCRCNLRQRALPLESRENKPITRNHVVRNRSTSIWGLHLLSLPVSSTTAYLVAAISSARLNSASAASESAASGAFSLINPWFRSSPHR